MGGKQSKAEAPEEKPVGEVTHFYGHLSVAVVKLASPISVGEQLRFKGATTDFEQTIESMQVEHQSVEKAKRGDLIGMKVENKVREGDLVYRVE